LRSVLEFVGWQARCVAAVLAGTLASAGGAVPPAADAQTPAQVQNVRPDPPDSLGDKQNTVRTLACEANIPPGFALAVIDQESGFDNGMRGSHGEIGVSQILPATARALGFDLKRLGEEFAYNARSGVILLRRLLRESGGDQIKALHSYRAGPGWVALPPRARSYVRAYVDSVVELMRTRYAGVACD
jgi:soluble lytic murein transglycosylase-like protein